MPTAAAADQTHRAADLRQRPSPPRGNPHEFCLALHRPDREPPPAQSSRGHGHRPLAAAVQLRLHCGPCGARRAAQTRQGRTRSGRRGRPFRCAQSPVGTRPERRAPRAGGCREQRCRRADEQPARLHQEHWRRGACGATLDARHDGASQGQRRGRAVAAQRCRQRVAQPRNAAHAQHAGDHYRRTDPFGAHWQHQDQLHRPGRHRRGHCGARLGGDAGALGLCRRQRRLPRQAQRQHAQCKRGQLDRRRWHRHLAEARQRRAHEL